MLSREAVDATLVEIAALEQQHRSNRAAFFGFAKPNGGGWTGSGINKAKAIQQSLTTPPADDARSAWNAAVSRVGALMG